MSEREQKRSEVPQDVSTSFLWGTRSEFVYRRERKYLSFRNACAIMFANASKMHQGEFMAPRNGDYDGVLYETE